MLAIPSHPPKNQSRLGYRAFLLTLLCSPSGARPLYGGPCLALPSGFWSGDGVLVCDPCCVIVPWAKPSMVTSTRVSSTALETLTLTFPFNDLSQSTVATTSGGWPTRASAITVGHATTQAPVSATTLYSPTPTPTPSASSSFSWSTLLSSSNPGTSQLTTLSDPVPSSTISSVPNETHAHAPKLSTTVIAVISVVSFLGALSLVLGILLFIRVRRRNRDQAAFQRRNR